MPARQHDVAPQVSELVRASTALALDLLARLDEESGSLFPLYLSTFAALALTYASPHGETSS
jgi:hypothetical protein